MSRKSECVCGCSEIQYDTNNQGQRREYCRECGLTTQHYDTTTDADEAWERIIAVDEPEQKAGPMIACCPFCESDCDPYHHPGGLAQVVCKISCGYVSMVGHDLKNVIKNHNHVSDMALENKL